MSTSCSLARIRQRLGWDWACLGMGLARHGLAISWSSCIVVCIGLDNVVPCCASAGICMGWAWAVIVVDWSGLCAGHGLDCARWTGGHGLGIMAWNGLGWAGHEPV
jgi:hypothetical protein